MSARDEILNAVRTAAARAEADGEARVDEAQVAARLAAHPRGPIPARTDRAPAALVELFAEQARAVDATVARVAGIEDVAAAVADYLQAESLPARLVAAPDPALADIDWTAREMIEVRSGPPLATDDVGVTGAVGGVAETGTVVTASGPHHPASLNFVPETHIVVMPAARIAATYEDVWDRIRAAARDGGPATGANLPRTVNFITGPSRSADIEQTLQLGAHGPRRLHIILVDAD